ncbi:MAG: hypothetical protein ABI721_02590 [Candidatus Dojkabacteria bacterium]
MDTINENIFKTIYNYLGEKSAELFKELYEGSSTQEQRTGMLELLVGVLGAEKVKELIKSKII